MEKINDRVHDILEKYGLENLTENEYQFRHFKEGEHIVSQGDSFSWFGIMMEGKAKIYRNSPDGKNLILAYYVENGLIGEMELLTDREKITTTVTAQSDVECIVLSTQVCRREFERNILFSQNLARITANKLLHSSDNYTSSALCTGEQRLAEYLLQGSVKGVFRELLTETASSIGLSYRHLLRLMEQFCKEGILEKKMDGYHIKDAKRLNSISANIAEEA